jgi:hypothetical protein
MQYPIRFTYPFWLRILMGTMGAFFLGAAMIMACAVPVMKIWIPFVLFGFGNAWYSLSSKIYLDADGIIQKRFGRETKIHFYNITRITDHAFSERIVIWGVDGKIAVEKQLNRYQEFYGLLTTLVPAHVLDGEYQKTFPLEVRIHRWLRGIYLGLGVIGILLFFHALLGPASARLDEIIIAGFLIFAGLVMYLLFPDRYVFDHHQIVVVYPGRHKVYAWDDLQDVFIENILNRETFSKQAVLVLKFTKGKELIQGSFVDYPIEKLVAVLSKYHQEILLRSTAMEG